MLSKLAGPFQVKEYFHWISKTLDFGGDLFEDMSFLRTMQRTLLPLPWRGEWQPPLEKLLPQRRPFKVNALAGKKIGIVATGGSGAMISTLGVMRACEEAGLQISAISACSGSALFLAPIAAGLSAEEAIDFVFDWRSQDYIDPRWRELLKIPLRLGRGFTGVLDMEVIERLYHERLGGVLLGDLPIPFYANIWDVDHNNVVAMGTRTTPNIRLARLVRAATSLPIFARPLEMDGTLYGDGGVINIFPAETLVEMHPELDYFIGINCFYPENFEGEDLSGWDRLTFSPIRVSPQPRYGQHLELARMNLRLIEDRCLMLHPVAYQDIKGVKFYEQFADRSRWPEFVIRGYYNARRNLALMDRQMASKAAA